jgi:hypothetical protein
LQGQALDLHGQKVSVSVKTCPGMTRECCFSLILDLRKIRHRARRGADFVQQLQTILTHNLERYAPFSIDMIRLADW